NGRGAAYRSEYAQQNTYQKACRDEPSHGPQPIVRPGKALGQPLAQPHAHRTGAGQGRALAFLLSVFRLHLESQSRKCLQQNGLIEGTEHDEALSLGVKLGTYDPFYGANTINQLRRIRVKIPRFEVKGKELGRRTGALGRLS